MQDRENFGKYLSQKRKEAHFTQEELANRLHVIPTTISKWERAITYPDITMIPKLCQELNISEHEFFMACDDEAMRSEQKEIQKYRTIKKVIYDTFLVGYLIAFVVCGICNYAIDRTLSWYWIVLVSLALSFTITNLPSLLKKDRYRWIKISSLVTGLVYLLLWVIHLVYGELPLWESFGIATFEFLLLWIFLLISTFTNSSKRFKGAILLLVLAICTAFTNPICEMLLHIPSESDNQINILCSYLLVVTALFLLISHGVSKNKK